MKNLELLVNQVQHARVMIDSDMTLLSLGIFLEVASKGDNYPVSEIIKKFHLNASTCSRNMYYLSGGFVRANEPRKGVGLIRTETSSTDRRALVVSLTQKGQAVIKSLQNVK